MPDIYSRDCDNCYEPYWDETGSDICQKCLDYT